MTKWELVSINSFLKERYTRIKPEEANKLNLNRIEKIDFSGNLHIKNNKKTNTGMILVKNGDLVISGINVEKGAVAIYEADQDALATIHYSSYEIDKSKIDIDYFKLFLKSRYFRDVVNTQIKGGIKTELKPKKFLPLKINLPDLETQVKIRNKLNSVYLNINEINKINNINEEYILKLRQSILQDAVQGKLISQNPNDEPASELLKKIKVEKEKLVKEGKIKKEKLLPSISKEEISFELPKGWEWVRLGEILTFNYGKGNNENKGNIPVYGANGILRYSTKSLVNEKCIIIGRKGSSGALNLVKEPCWPSDVSYFVIPSKNLDFYFIYYLLKNLNLEKIGKGIKPGLNRNEVYSLLISLPPLSEQKRIVEKVDLLMRFCDELKKQTKENKNNSDKLKEAILKEMFEY